LTRFVWDKYTKDYLQELLVPHGKVTVSKSVTSEIKEIDVWFDPNASEILPELGLLGRFCQTPCLFEPYRNPVTIGGIRDCLSKWLAVGEELERLAHRQKTPLLPEDIPRLWILSPTVSSRILTAFSGHLKPDWGAGVYFLPEALRTALVVIHQLPEIQETLWVRLLGRGGTRERAINELEALPASNPLRSISLKSLYNLSKNLEALPRKSREDRNFIMRLAPLYQQDREQAIQEGRAEGIQAGRAEGIQAGRAEGIQAGEAKLVLRLLQRRFGEIPQNLTEQIQELSVEQIENLGEALLDFQSRSDLVSWLEG
jgi:hypothetical protein